MDGLHVNLERVSEPRAELGDIELHEVSGHRQSDGDGDGDGP